MKKQSIFCLAALVVVLMMASCKKNEAKDAKLVNQNDSLNYSLGLVNGEQIKQYYMQDVANENSAIDAFIKALDNAYKSNQEVDEMYELGVRFGGSLKQQEKDGLMGDPNLKFDYNLVKQGFINGINETEGGMTAMEAQQYIQATMMQLQEEQMRSMQGNTIEEEIIQE